MATLPKGEGVLAPGAQGPYRLLLFVAGWFVAGIATAVAAFTLFGQPAHAATNASLERQLATLVQDTSEIKQDLAVVKCLLHVGGICPSK